ncbi:hypothetical protein LAV82_23355 [Bacillus sp. ILBB4]|nr:hypothetical protein [Bacillus sp. ILBB4]
MTTTTTNKATKAYTFMELLQGNVPEGQQAIARTENDLYGTTIVKKGNTFLNARTNKPLELTSELMSTKFRLVNKEEQVTLGAFLQAYNAGKQVKVEIGKAHRVLQKVEDDVPKELMGLFSLVAEVIGAPIPTNFMTMEELTEGKFFILG